MQDMIWFCFHVNLTTIQILEGGISPELSTEILTLN